MPSKKKLALHWKILIALVFSVIITLMLRVGGLQESTFASGFISICEFIGVIFMNALKMIVVPIIVSSIICGMMNMGSEKDFKRLGLKTLMYYLATSILAIVLGLTMVNLFQPGIVDQDVAEAILGQSAKPEEFLSKVEGKAASDLTDIFVRMVPPNIIMAATQNSKLLSLITISVIAGFFLNRLSGKIRQTQASFWRGIHDMSIMITDFVICFAPIGVFGLVTPVIFRTGLDLIAPLSMFFVTVLLALAIHFFVTMSLILKFVGKTNPIKHLKAMESAILTAFSTSSSAATLPVTMDRLEKNAGISNRITSFTLPLGATVNMDGTALYECIVVLFIAQFYSVVGDFQIDLAMQATVVLLALMTSIGVAGIPSASLVAITIILAAVGLPLEAIGLVIVVDRVLDMCRTAVNVYSDSVGAVVIAKSEGEGLYEKMEF